MIKHRQTRPYEVIWEGNAKDLYETPVRVVWLKDNDFIACEAWRQDATGKDCWQAITSDYEVTKLLETVIIDQLRKAK